MLEKIFNFLNKIYSFWGQFYSKITRLFNEAGSGSPLRILTICIICLYIIIIGGWYYFHHSSSPITNNSYSASLPNINKTPGGTKTDAMQEKVSHIASKKAANQAIKDNQSYVPPISSGVANTSTIIPDMGIINKAMGNDLSKNSYKTDNQIPKPVKIPTVSDPIEQSINKQTSEIQTNNIDTPSAENMNRQKAATDLVASWNNDFKSPQTQIIINLEQSKQNSDQNVNSKNSSTINKNEKAIVPVKDGFQNKANILIPAGRGIYAHTIIAVDSDTPGQIILEADSGPITGDRMLGSFSSAGGNTDRLIVRITSIFHNGETIPVNGIVIAPSSMETSVASSVDQHYVSRFLLPAAAAFVQGLGSAFETTGNTIGSISPFGGYTFTQDLNIGKQLGIAAGTAAQLMGNALQQSAPTRPTVHLAANSSVGIIFTDNIVSKQITP